MFIIIPIAVIVLIIVLVVVVKKVTKSRRGKCSKCKTKLTYPNDFSFAVSSLRWRKEKKTETKGDFKYEITYKVYYRTLWAESICPKCGNVKKYTKDIDVWRSDSDYSQSDAEEVRAIQNGIYDFFGKQVFGETNRSAIQFEVIET